MRYTGLNAKDVKYFNRSALLNLLNDRGAVSRKDISEELGITAATVTLICSDMLSSGILCEKGEAEQEKHVGRKKILVDINYQYKFVLCLNIEAEITTLTLSDLSGSIIAKRQLETNGNIEPEKFLQEVALAGEILINESGIMHENILGVGVSLPGVVFRNEGISQYAYRVWNKPAAVREILSKYFAYPVIIENNVKAFAEGELTYGSGKACDNILFVKWGPGVGSALIIDGRIYNTEKNGAAEIGHIRVKKDGPICRCGKRGCLETFVSAHAIAERVRKSFTKNTMPALFTKFKGDASKIKAGNISEWVNFPDEALQNILSEAADMMAGVVTNLQRFLVPEKVIVYGKMFELESIYEKFRASCSDYDAEDIKCSELADKADYVGALAVVMNEMFL